MSREEPSWSGGQVAARQRQHPAPCPLGAYTVSAFTQCTCPPAPASPAFPGDGESARICGMVSNSGPNGEPLACGYAPHEQQQPHSWATLPTGTQGDDGTHCAFVYDPREPLRSRCWRTREQHAPDYSHDFVAPPSPPRPAEVDRKAAANIARDIRVHAWGVARDACSCGKSCSSYDVWLDHQRDFVAAALAPLLGVTGGGE